MISVMNLLENGYLDQVWRGHELFENHGTDVDMSSAYNRCPPNSVLGDLWLFITKPKPVAQRLFGPWAGPNYKDQRSSPGQVRISVQSGQPELLNHFHNTGELLLNKKTVRPGRIQDKPKILPIAFRGCSRSLVANLRMMRNGKALFDWLFLDEDLYVW